MATTSTLADALLVIAEAFLAGKAAGADDPEVYQVVVHVGTDALDESGRSARVPAETPAAAPRVAGDPADPARCHVEDGPAISVSTAQMIGCTAALSWMAHDGDGSVLRLGRRRRRPNAALRRAARERDKCRCRFPGCESRRVDLHHIVYWVNGGRTDLENLISLCKWHHMLVHERGYLIAAARDGTFAFYRPDGTSIPLSPPLPTPDATIGDCHDAEITPETIIPPWYGQRLDLDHAIYVCFANARTARERQADGCRAGEPAAREGVRVYEPNGWADRMRQYYDEHPPGRDRVSLPVPVLRLRTAPDAAACGPYPGVRFVL